MNIPNISDNFTMDDIRKIRNYNSIRHNNMTKRQVIDDINNGAEEMIKKLEEHKRLQ
ncbi:MAG: hypothetical protein LBC86_10390 [Oscillospiraceae bacterium]|jgi:hypothetical protein|nr:hypothetical protein [Oscillospiraceae bacterium]